MNHRLHPRTVKKEASHFQQTLAGHCNLSVSVVISVEQVYCMNFCFGLFSSLLI